MVKLIVLLPALNEEKAIGLVIKDIPREALSLMGIHTDVVVVDGGSTDNTRTIASNMGCIVFRSPLKGKGNQVRSIKPFISAMSGDYIIMMDSDHTYPSRYIIPIVRMLMLGIFDVVSGYRQWDKTSMTTVHAIGNEMLTFLSNLLYKQKTNDLCTGYWGFTSDAFNNIEIRAKCFELEANIFKEVNLKQLSYGQLPIAYNARIGQGKLRMKDGISIAMELINRNG